jgi:hypothetical protein
MGSIANLACLLDSKEEKIQKKILFFLDRKQIQNLEKERELDYLTMHPGPGESSSCRTAWRVKYREWKE